MSERPLGVPELILERFRLGELSDDEMRMIEERVRSDEGLRMRIQELEESDREILAALPPARFASVVRRRAGVRHEATPRWSAVRRLAVVPAAVTLAALVLLWRSDRAPEDRGVAPVTDVTRIKGLGPVLRIYLRADPPRLLEPEDVVVAGDILQIDYVSAGRSSGLIASFDGRGVVTPHYPSSGSGWANLLPSGEHPTSFAFQLDDAPGYEQFVLVTADSSVSASVVWEMIYDAAERSTVEQPEPLESVPPGCKVFSITLRKRR
jgi:hypothetical protein